MRIGVIGVGGMGAFHARALAAMAGVDVAVVAEPDAERRTALASELGCASTADGRAVATDTALDGVVIASPDDTHAELALAALAAERAILCEKPLATTVADARAVLDAEQAAGRRRIQLGFMREYDPAHEQLVAELPSLGGIDHVRAVHRNANAQGRSRELIVGQSMVHDIHTVRYLTGREFVEVTSFGSGPADGSFRHVLVVGRLDDGAHAAIEFDDGGFGYEVAVEVLGRRGDAVTGAPTHAVTRRDGVVARHLGADWFGRFAEAYRRQDAAWVASIRDGAATGPSSQDGYAAQVVVEAVLASLRSGRPEAVPVGEPPGAG